ncbi:MAG TPA: MFS transporter [Sphingomonas sp.]|uniref:MFS transporter n=1 Tax=Sphingomonas sp. TaxID=28214 RepID=UPI002ED8BE43
MTEDPRRILADAPMRRMQYLVIALCVVLNALDGFDVLAISFASPGIAAEWGIDRAALGVVLSVELIGMAAGSVLIGGLADRAGRRPTTLGCLLVMTTGMALATTANTVWALSLWRLFTGFGIGGMLVCTSAIVAEFANDRSRNLAVAIMAAGYPAGAIVGGSIASLLLASGGWRDVFLFGAGATALFLPVAWFLLPESVGFLLQNRATYGLDRVNAVLGRLRHGAIARLPSSDGHPPRPNFRLLFAPRLARTTILLTIAYFAHIMTFYFILKWIPKIVVDMGHAPATAGQVLVWANVGGLAGALLLSLLSWRIAGRTLAITVMLLSVFAVILFGRGQDDLGHLALVGALTGFCTNAGVVALYALIAQAFPTAVRGSGTGFVVGVGRGGAALGPVLAGYLFNLDFGLQVVAVVMASGSLLAATALLFVRQPARDQPVR